MFALDAAATHEVIAAVRKEVDLPIGAKLSPNAIDVGEIASAAAEAGADWVTVINTVWGAAIDIEERQPSLSAGSAAIPAWRSSRSRSAVFLKFARPIQGCRSWVWEGCSRGRMASSS